jgi:hypothetical protein
MNPNADTNRLPEIDLEVLQAGEELNASEITAGYSESDYPSMNVMLEHLKKSTTSMPFSYKELAKNGVVVADEMTEYLNKRSVSSSACKEVCKTPLHYFHYANQTFKRPESSAFNLGTFAHKAFLEPGLFDAVISEPNYSLASHDGVSTGINFWEKIYITKGEAEKWKYNIDYIRALMKGKDDKSMADKKEYLQLMKSHAPLEIIKEDDKLIIDIVKANYNRYGGGILPRILRHSIKEVSFYGKDSETGLDVKVRPDGLQLAKNIGVNAVISFKTTSANTIDKFISDSCKFQYELSEGMYQDVLSNITGKKFNVTIMVMLQTVAPFLPALFWWDSSDINNGKYKYRHALRTIKDCTDANLWPGFDAAAESGAFGCIAMKQPDWNQKELRPVEVTE